MSLILYHVKLLFLVLAIGYLSHGTASSKAKISLISYFAVYSAKVLEVEDI